MWQELTLLFTEMGAVAAVCLIAGLIFVIIEIFNPGFGFFGIAGSILLIISLIIRTAQHGNGNPITLFFLQLLIIIVVLAAAFIVMTILAKKGLLGPDIINTATAVPVGITEGTADYTSLIGKQGVAYTMLRPAGIVVIDDVRYDVVADGEYIAKDAAVEVSKIEGVRIVVKQVL